MRLRAVTSRLMDLCIVLVSVSTLVFLMIRLIPGDAVAIMLGANTEVTPERLAELRHRLGLDLPLITQYVQWVGQVLSGDLGTSLWTGRPVLGEITANLAPTVELTTLALIIGAGLALPLGMAMASVRGDTARAIMQAASVVGLTVPSFWLGILMVLAVSTLAPNWQILGYVPFTVDPLGNLARMILPAIALALPILASLARTLRSSMLDALGEDYIRTARAKGLSERVVVAKHALRNAVLPYLTNVGIMMGYLLGGSIVVEQVFAIPGLGRLILGAIAERNYPLLQASVLLVTVAVVLVNFLVDMLYVAVDPRIRA